MGESDGMAAMDCIVRVAAMRRAAMPRIGTGDDIVAPFQRLNNNISVVKLTQAVVAVIVVLKPGDCDQRDTCELALHKDITTRHDDFGCSVHTRL